LAGILGGGNRTPFRLPKPDDDEEDSMLRMSFMDHLEELRHRLLMVVYGMIVAFCITICFANQMWDIVREPARVALVHLGVNPPNLVLISPMDSFQIIWMKLPLLAAIFLASPWVLYQLWAFIAPGLYKHERRWAVPFVTTSAGLFIGGGFFAYFIAFRYGLEFLLGLGMQGGITPGINVNEYYDLFVDVMLAVGIVFEIPVLLFLLTLVRVVNPGFLVRHSRYAILAIVVLAAVITPTGDVFNLTLFATPMIILFYVGIFASYLLVLRREKRKFPWLIVLRWLGFIIVILITVLWLVGHYFGYRIVIRPPFFVR
jgi:sec-independent protein translocase protein TatC